MEAREITEVPPYVVGQDLDDIFKLQGELIEEYVKIEAVPQPPLQITSAESQVILKDFISRVIEELGEGFESYNLLYTLATEGAPVQRMLDPIWNFVEEIADAMHFFIELLIFSGISTAQALWFTMDRTLRLDLLKLDKLDSSTLDSYITLVDQVPGFKTRRVKWKIKPFFVNRGKDMDPAILGGRRVSEDMLNDQKLILWELTFLFQLARNTLRNKAWKQTQDQPKFY